MNRMDVNITMKLSKEEQKIVAKNQASCFEFTFPELCYETRLRLLRFICFRVQRIEKSILKGCKNDDERKKVTLGSKRLLLKWLLRFENVNIEEILQRHFYIPAEKLMDPDLQKYTKLDPAVLDKEINDLISRYRRTLCLRDTLSKEITATKDVDNLYKTVCKLESVIKISEQNKVSKDEVEKSEIHNKFDQVLQSLEFLNIDEDITVDNNIDQLFLPKF